MYQNIRSITVHRIRPLDDMNEITYHMAAVMVSSVGESVTRMPSFSSPVQAAGGVKFEQNRAGVSSMGMGAGVSPADRCVCGYPCFLQYCLILAINRVLQIVKDRGDPSTGMSVADIAANCQMPRDAVARLMEQLSNDGKVSLRICTVFLFCFGCSSCGIRSTAPWTTSTLLALEFFTVLSFPS